MLPNVPPVDTIELLLTSSPERTISDKKVATPATLKPPPTNKSLWNVPIPTNVETPLTCKLPPMLTFFSTPSPPSRTTHPVSLSFD